MSLLADYVQFCAKVECQGVTLTFVTHVISVNHIADCKYMIKVHSQQKNNIFLFFPIQKHMRPNLTLM